MSAPREGHEARTGDRVVAIAGLLALLLVGFFGDEPAPPPQPVVSAVHGAQR